MVVIANTLQGLLSWSPCRVLDSNKQGGIMEVIINGTKYIIDITEDELFQFFEVNSIDVKLEDK